MQVFIFVRNVVTILEIIFFLLVVYALITGLRIKNYDNLKKYGWHYLVLNIFRRICNLVTQRAVSVSIIGGADGPTSIFIAGKLGTGFSIATCILLLVIILIVVGVVVGLKKKK